MAAQGFRGEAVQASAFRSKPAVRQGQAGGFACGLVNIADPAAPRDMVFAGAGGRLHVDAGEKGV